MLKNFFTFFLARCKVCTTFVTQLTANKNSTMKKTRIYEGIEVIDLETVRSAKYEENIERYGDHSNTCFLCGKRTAETLHVHYTTDGFLVPTGFDLDEVELSIRGIESQGCFPVGSECAKKVGKTYLVHIVK